MSDAEVIKILICFHFNSTFYNRFVEVMPRCFVAMTMFLRLACFGECTGISFVDRLGWYVGFKLHLLCNEKGELINFVLTRANVHAGAMWRSSSRNRHKAGSEL